MAERYAVATGLWTAATFDEGTLPGVNDTVHANGYTVTIDQDITVAALSTRVGVTAVAGGGFTVSSAGRTIRANLYSGTTNCLSCSASSGTFTLHGWSYGSNTTASIYALRNTGAGLVVAYGHAFGDVGHGINVSSTGDLYLYGDAVGGVAYTCAGINVSGSSTGHGYVFGTARSHASGAGPGAYGSSSGTSCVIVQAAEQGAGGGWPIQGKVLFHDFSNIAFGVRNSSGTLKTIGVLPHSSFSTPRAFT